MSTVSERSVLLVVPPFQMLARPALGVSQLKANLQEQGIATSILYLNFLFAERIGLDLYEWISDQTFDVLLGEFIFSDVLFHHSDNEVEQYVHKVLKDADCAQNLPKLCSERDPSLILRKLMQQASAFCDDAGDQILKHDHWMVGFTSSYQQNCASLAVIRKIKQSSPEIITVMGGANCESEMGQELFRQFSEIDYIGQGECDYSFVHLVRSLQNGGRPVSIPGILSRGNGHQPPAPSKLLSEDLDSLPYPEFNDYFDQLETNNFDSRIAPGLVMETSRGCWWGSRQPCTFCGLNGDERGYRSKSPSRARDEMVHLVKRYGAHHIYMADNILDMKYFRTVLPELAGHPVVDIFYETKSNLSRHQMHMLARSRISWIQPGIESISDRALRLMRKGTTKIKNIQLLKWCAEYGIWAGWNYLYGFPGEKDDEIEALAHDVEAIHHLYPPTNAAPVRVDRFSTYFTQPDTYGLAPLGPAEPYHHIYPFHNESLKRLAYFHRSDFFERVKKGDAFKTVREIVQKWKKVYQHSFLLAVHRKNSLIIIDTRPCSRQYWHRLVGIRRRVYEICDRGRTVQQICDELGSVDPAELEPILKSFVRSRLMIHADGQYLSLAVDARSNCGKVIRAASGGFVKPAKSSAAVREKFLRVITFRIPPGKIINTLLLRIAFIKGKILRKIIFHFTRKLSGSFPDDAVERIHHS